MLVLNALSYVLNFVQCLVLRKIHYMKKKSHKRVRMLFVASIRTFLQVRIGITPKGNPFSTACLLHM